MPISGRPDFLPESEFYNVLDSILPGESLVSLGGTVKSRIYLTRLEMTGVQEMHAYSTSDKRFYDYLEYEPFKTLEDTSAYLKKLIDIEGSVDGRTSIGWFVRTSRDQKIVGSARIVNIDYKRQSVSWGYGLEPSLWGQGYVQELQRILLDYVFNTLRLNRLHGTALCSNKLTISTLQSIGMKEEGVHRQAMRNFRGEYLDSWAYSMLYDDYKSSKAYISTSLGLEELKSVENCTTEASIIRDKVSKFFTEYGDIEHEVEFSSLPFWDSLKQMEMVIFLETEFQVNLTLNQVIELKSIQAVTEVIANAS